jgi:hypothetical protein
MALMSILTESSRNCITLSTNHVMQACVSISRFTGHEEVKEQLANLRIEQNQITKEIF